MENHGIHGISGTAAFDVLEIIGNKVISQDELDRLATSLLNQMSRLSGWMPNPTGRPREIYPVHWS